MRLRIKNKNVTRISILLVVFFAISVVSYQYVSASVSLNPAINASNTPAPASNTQQIAVSGNNIDIVYLEAGILYYDNNATSFVGTRVQQSNATATSPEISVSGADKHIVWLQSNALLYNNTAVPGSAKKLFPAAITSSATSNMLAVSGSDVHIVYREGGILKYINNTNNFQNVASPVVLGAGVTNNQQLKVSGAALHIAWQNGTGIYYRNNTENFAFPIQYFGTGTFPQLALLGPDVHLIWKDGNPIKYANLTASGFSSPITISNIANVATVPNIASGGGNVYAVWQETIGNNEVFFASSATGFTPVNLSNNAGASTVPQITVSGSNVVVTWLDSGAINMRYSSDGGNNFDNAIVISNAVNVASNPKIAVSDPDVVLSWLENTGSANDVFVRAGIFSSTLLEFDQTEYSLSDNPVLTFTDPSKAGDGTSGEIIAAAISSTSDVIGISVNLTESGNTGIFTGTFSLTSGLSDDPSDTLQVSYGDQLSASYSTDSASSQIVTITITLDSANYDYADFANITVNDNTANTTPGIDSVTVHVTTNQDPTGLDLTLDETSGNSGVFSNAQLAFMVGNSVFSTDDTVNLQITAPGYLNQTILVMGVNSTTTPTGINLQLTETGSTGIFEGPLILSSSTTDAATGTIQVSASDFITFNDPDNLFTFRGMINPNPNNSTGIIGSAFPGGDIVTVTYGLATDAAGVLDLSASGGGGGGISRAGLVVQAVGAIALFNGGGGGTSGPPSFDDKSFTLSESFGGILSDEPSILKESQSIISMEFKLPGGFNNLDHIGLYANIGPGQDKYDSDTYIYFDRFKTPQVTIHDPHGYFKSVNVDVTEPIKSTIAVNYLFDFAKSLDNSNVVFEAWNLQRDSALKEIPSLFKVDNQAKPEILPETETIQPTIQRPPVPDWIKSNAAWWGNGAIDDNEFTNGIGYLIQNKIIDIPELLQANVSPEKLANPDTGLIEPEAEFIPIVPDWVKNNAIWWSEGQLTDDDFLVGIKYLLEKGIIQVRI